MFRGILSIHDSRENTRSTDFENILSSDLVNFYRILAIEYRKSNSNNLSVICNFPIMRFYSKEYLVYRSNHDDSLLDSTKISFPVSYDSFIKLKLKSESLKRVR